MWCYWELFENASRTCEEHEKPVEDSRNILETSLGTNENRMGTKNLRKLEPHVSDFECGWVHGQDQIRGRVSSPEEECF